jgi:hypothetical protein
MNSILIFLSAIQFLSVHGLDTDETVNIFAKNRIYLDNFHLLTDHDLLKMGITSWGTRISILEAIQSHLRQLNQVDSLKGADQVGAPVGGIAGGGLVGIPGGAIGGPGGIQMVGFGIPGIGASVQSQNFGSRGEIPKEDREDFALVEGMHLFLSLLSAPSSLPLPPSPALSLFPPPSQYTV